MFCRLFSYGFTVVAFCENRGRIKSGGKELVYRAASSQRNPRDRTKTKVLK